VRKIGTQPFLLENFPRFLRVEASLRLLHLTGASEGEKRILLRTCLKQEYQRTASGVTVGVRRTVPHFEAKKGGGEGKTARERGNLGLPVKGIKFHREKI